MPRQPGLPPLFAGARDSHLPCERMDQIMYLQCSTPADTAALPDELADLGQHGYLDDERLVAYLEYLRYWRRPEYARFIKSGRGDRATTLSRTSRRYPHALVFLELLQHESFRKRIAQPHFVQFVHEQQARRRHAQPAFTRRRCCTIRTTCDSAASRRPSDCLLCYVHIMSRPVARPLSPGRVGATAPCQ